MSLPGQTILWFYDSGHIQCYFQVAKYILLFYRKQMHFSNFVLQKNIQGLFLFVPYQWCDMHLLEQTTLLWFEVSSSRLLHKNCVLLWKLDWETMNISLFLCYWSNCFLQSNTHSSWLAALALFPCKDDGCWLSRISKMHAYRMFSYIWILIAQMIPTRV